MVEFMPRFVLVKLLEHLKSPAVFPATQWPLHLTLVPDFSIDWEPARLHAELGRALAGVRSLVVTASSEALFGPARNVRVTLIGKTPELSSLHEHAVGALVAGGAVFDSPGYVGDGYRPHVTIWGTRHLAEGDTVAIDEVSIVDLAANGDAKSRALLSTIRLGRKFP